MLIVLSLAWLVGLVFRFPFSGWFILAGAMLAILFTALRLRNRPLLVSALCLLIFSMASLRLHFPQPHPDNPSLGSYNGLGQVDVLGVVDRDPEVKERGLEVRLRALELKAASDWEQVSGVALLRLDRFANFGYGDRLMVTGRLETPPQGPNFDYRQYLARQGIGSLLYASHVEVVKPGSGPLAQIYSLRQHLARSLARSLPEPQASLGQGILLGLRGDIPREVNEAFNRSGTTHVLAISGQNISIVAGMLLSLASWILGRRRPTYLVLALAILWLYAVMAGGQAPVIRAAIMASLFILAIYVGRPGSAPTALALAAAVMAGLQPSILWDVSFQLSFLSMAGLVYLAPRFDDSLFQRLSLPKPVVSTISMSLAAILFTWPVIAYDFGRVSVVGLPASLMALPALPAIIITTAAAAGLGLLYFPLGMATGWLAWLPLSYLWGIAWVFASLPFASLPVESFPASLVWGYYAILVGALVGVSQQQRLGSHLSRASKSVTWLKEQSNGVVRRVPWRGVSLALAPIALLLWIAALVLPPGGRLYVSVLDVGEGEAILIQTPSRHQILINGSASGQALSLALGHQLPFWDRSLDLAVLAGTQGFPGLIEIVDRYTVTKVWKPGAESPSPAFQAWRERTKGKNIPVSPAQPGLKLVEGNYMELEVLSAGIPDGMGIVMRLKLGDISFLLVLDGSREMEAELLARRAIGRSTVLMMSGRSGLEGFLLASSPAAVVITGSGVGTSEVETLARQRIGEDRLYLAREQGTVNLITDGRRLWVKTDRGPR